MSSSVLGCKNFEFYFWFQQKTIQ